MTHCKQENHICCDESVTGEFKGRFLRRPDFELNGCRYASRFWFKMSRQISVVPGHRVVQFFWMTEAKARAWGLKEGVAYAVKLLCDKRMYLAHRVEDCVDGTFEEYRINVLSIISVADDVKMPSADERVREASRVLLNIKRCVEDLKRNGMHLEISYEEVLACLGDLKYRINVRKNEQLLVSDKESKICSHVAPDPECIAMLFGRVSHARLDDSLFVQEIWKGENPVRHEEMSFFSNGMLKDPNGMTYELQTSEGLEGKNGVWGVWRGCVDSSDVVHCGWFCLVPSGRVIGKIDRECALEECLKVKEAERKRLLDDVCKYEYEQMLDRKADKYWREELDHQVHEGFFSGAAGNYPELVE